MTLWGDISTVRKVVIVEAKRVHWCEWADRCEGSNSCTRTVLLERTLDCIAKWKLASHGFQLFGKQEMQWIQQNWMSVQESGKVQNLFCSNRSS